MNDGPKPYFTLPEEVVERIVVAAVEETLKPIAVAALMMALVDRMRRIAVTEDDRFEALRWFFIVDAHTRSVLRGTANDRRRGAGGATESRPKLEGVECPQRSDDRAPAEDRAG